MTKPYFDMANGNPDAITTRKSPMRTYYCLACEKPNNCKCGNEDNRFTHSDKLRVPLTTKNKEKFRQFLKDCPTFPNMVPDHLQPKFRGLLRKVKFFDKAINGFEWTKVSQ
jgi:hypothetical protein